MRKPLDYLPLMTAIFTTALGGLMVLAWIFHFPSIIQIHPKFAPMQFNTALSIFGLGTAFLLLKRRKIKAARAIAIGVGLMGTLTFLQYLFSVDLHIDQFFINCYLPATLSHPGRMAPNTALCLVLMGLSFLLMSRNKINSKLYFFIVFTASVVSAFAILTFIGLFITLPLEYGWGNYASMAVHTAFTFVLLGVGVVHYASKILEKDIKDQYNFFPVSVALAILIGTVVVWQASLLDQSRKIRNLTVTHASFIQSEVSLQLNQTIQSIERMARRFMMNPSITQEMWEDDANQYTQHHSVLEGLGFVDSSFKVKWTYPTTNLRLVNRFDLRTDPVRKETTERARYSRLVQLTPITDFKAGGRGFGIFVPIYLKSGAFGGFVSAGVKPTKLFKVIEDNQNFQFEVNYQSELLYSNVTLDENLKRQWGVDTSIDIHDQTWSLFVVPTMNLIREAESGTPYIILFAGIVISLILGFTIQISMTSNYQTKVIEGQEKTLRNLIDSSPLPITVVSADQKVIEWNLACEQVFGWKKSEVVGKYVPHVPPEQMANSRMLFDKIMASETAVRAEANRMTRDGREITIRISAIGLRDEKGKPYGLMGLMEDVTAQKNTLVELQKARVQAEEALKVKSEFLANMSHEIRTPMNGIIGMSALLADTQLDEEQSKFAKIIKNSGEALLLIINDILDFSKIEAGKLTLEKHSINLRKDIFELEELLQIGAKEKNIKLYSAICQDVPEEIMGDSGRIRQVIMNLVGNAVKFTRKGKVELKVSFDSATQYLKFEVEDTGDGISEDQQHKLFSSFSQVHASSDKKYGGTGLGLAISKQLVEMMGGKIGFQSTLGVGSTFWFTLPFVAAEKSNVSVAKSAPLSAKLPNFGNEFKVLVAEDNHVNQLVATKMLEKLGCKVDVVANGLETVAAIETIHYDAILMDCHMPEMDGFTATRQIRAIEKFTQKQPIPIIALTANAMKEDEAKCLESGMDDFVSKPVVITVLAEKLSKWLTHKQKAA